jgi:hypothetical protein
MITCKEYKINDLNCDILVEINSSIRDMFSYVDQYIENFEDEWFYADDDAFAILYKDGSWDFIDGNYDGHKIKRINVESMRYDNSDTSMVYGNYDINYYGVVNPSDIMYIDDNITEVEIKD